MLITVSDPPFLLHLDKQPIHYWFFCLPLWRNTYIHVEINCIKIFCSRQTIWKYFLETINLCAIVLVQYMASVVIHNVSFGHRSLLHFIFVPLRLDAYNRHSVLLINSSDPFKSWLSSIIKLLRPFPSVLEFFPSNFEWLLEAINNLMK